MKVGQRAQLTRKITERDVLAFSNLTGDTNPIHIDDTYAKKTRFKGRIVHGMLVAALISAVLGTKLPGWGAIYLKQVLKFIRPVSINDNITTIVRVIKYDSKRHRVTLCTKCVNQLKQLVILGEAELLVNVGYVHEQKDENGF